MVDTDISSNVTLIRTHRVVAEYLLVIITQLTTLVPGGFSYLRKYENKKKVNF